MLFKTVQKEKGPYIVLKGERPGHLLGITGPFFRHLKRESIPSLKKQGSPPSANNYEIFLYRSIFGKPKGVFEAISGLVHMETLQLFADKIQFPIGKVRF